MSDVQIESSNGSVRLSGRLGFGSATELWGRRKEFLNGSPELVLDLSGLEQTDSAGLACLISLQGELHRQNRELVLVNVPPQLLNLARVSGVDSILPIRVTGDA